MAAWLVHGCLASTWLHRLVRGRQLGVEISLLPKFVLPTHLETSGCTGRARVGHSGQVLVGTEYNSSSACACTAHTAQPAAPAANGLHTAAQASAPANGVAEVGGIQPGVQVSQPAGLCSRTTCSCERNRPGGTPRQHGSTGLGAFERSQRTTTTLQALHSLGLPPSGPHVWMLAVLQCHAATAAASFSRRASNTSASKMPASLTVMGLEAIMHPAVSRNTAYLSCFSTQQSGRSRGSWLCSSQGTAKQPPVSVRCTTASLPGR